MVDVDLAGRVALVTGGASGIGAACTLALAKAGADVAIGVHGDPAKGEECRRAVEALGRRVIVVTADVGLEAEVEAAFDAVGAGLGLPDILVNAAGLNMTDVPVSRMSTDQWTRVVGADLTGSFLTSRRFVRDLQWAKRPGAIVNVTSIHAFAVRGGGADYVAAKAGQTGLTRTLAIEVAADRITVNAIAPGMILTPMNERAMKDEAYRRDLESHIPMKRAGTPEEVAGVAVFLASPAGAYITGAEIVIDGGLSLVQATGA